MWDFWHYWAEIREGIDWLEQLLALPGASGPTDARARGLDALAGLVYWQGNPGRAWDLYEEAVAIRRSLGDDRALARALFHSAWAAAAAYDFDKGTVRATEARDLFAKVGRRGERAAGERLDRDRAGNRWRGRRSRGGRGDPSGGLRDRRVPPDKRTTLLTG